MGSQIGKLSNAQLRKLAAELSKAGRLKAGTTASLEKLSAAHEKVVAVGGQKAPELGARGGKILGLGDK
jgi:hypothetical protein